MGKIRYCTPEWLEGMRNAFYSNPEYEEKLKKLTTKVGWLIRAEPEWGIEHDIIFCTSIAAGRIEDIGFYSEEDTRANMDFILAATPQEWKKLLRRESKFLTNFMIGKVTLEHGSRVAMLSLVPYTDTVMDLLTEVDLQFQDEMSADELESYSDEIKAYRSEQGV
jgi:hypothetical protein